MDITEGLKMIDSHNAEGLHRTLGMEFFSTENPDTLRARMPVDHRNIQPAGYLNGGASLALAETIAGIGSYSLCPGRPVFGMSVTCNHLHPIRQGNYATAVARIIHKGHTTHLWRVEISNENGELVSVISVTNFIVNEK